MAQLDALPPLRPPHYRPPREGVRDKRRQFWCPPDGCYPGHLASQRHALNWSYLITLEAPPGMFADAFNAWWPAAQEAWVQYWAESGPPGLETAPFWSCVLARHDPEFLVDEIMLGRVPRRHQVIHGVGRRIIFPPEEIRRDAPGLPHTHLLVGNVDYLRVLEAVRRWPFPQPPKSVKAVSKYNGGAWAALHYIYAQTEWRFGHRWDPFQGRALLCPPIESPQLELLIEVANRRLAAYRSAGVRGTPWARARAKKAAQSRWHQYRLRRLINSFASFTTEREGFSFLRRPAATS